MPMSLDNMFKICINNKITLVIINGVVMLFMSFVRVIVSSFVVPYMSNNRPPIGERSVMISCVCSISFIIGKWILSFSKPSPLNSGSTAGVCDAGAGAGATFCCTGGLWSCDWSPQHLVVHYGSCACFEARNQLVAVVQVVLMVVVVQV